MATVTRVASVCWTTVCVACAAAPEDSGLPVTEMRIEGPVAFTAVTGQSTEFPEWLETVVRIQAGPAGARLQYSGCPVTLRVYREPERREPAAWDQLAVPNTACTAPLIFRRIDGRGVLDLTAMMLPREVLGDSLPSGTYYVGAVVRPNGETTVLPAGTVVLSR